jgi:hypothetical protein
MSARARHIFDNQCALLARKEIEVMPESIIQSANETASEDDPIAGQDESGADVRQSQVNDGTYVWSDVQGEYILLQSMESVCDDGDVILSDLWRRRNCYQSQDGEWYINEDRRDEAERHGARRTPFGALMSAPATYSITNARYLRARR